MAYFLRNFIYGASSISLFPFIHKYKCYTDFKSIEDRAIKENISLKETVNRHFFEIMVGQISNFLAIIALMLFTVYMVYKNIPEFYCFAPILMANFLLLAPKIYLHYSNN